MQITKLENASLSDFTLCEAELLPKLLKQLEESLMRFFRTCINSLIVCVGYVGLSGSLEVNFQILIGVRAEARKEYRDDEKTYCVFWGFQYAWLLRHDGWAVR
jgi:hypothetical protein